MVFETTILHCKFILGRDTWDNEMNIGTNHAPGTELIDCLMTCSDQLSEYKVAYPLQLELVDRLVFINHVIQILVQIILL